MIITHIEKTYVIFICLKDVFGKNLPIYTFNNICEQDNSLTLGGNMFLKEEIHRLTFPKTFTILDKKAELGRC